MRGTRRRHQSPACWRIRWFAAAIDARGGLEHLPVVGHQAVTLGLHISDLHGDHGRQSGPVAGAVDGGAEAAQIGRFVTCPSRPFLWMRPVNTKGRRVSRPVRLSLTTLSDPVDKDSECASVDMARARRRPLSCSGFGAPTHV